jgi:hypothetical protein
MNLVPNPSFEQDTACPSNAGQINRLKNWYDVNPNADFYNKCYNGPFNYCNIPSNALGNQYPPDTSCKAYIGMYTRTFAPWNETV